MATIDHTLCYAVGLHDASAKGRAECRTRPLRREWWAIRNDLEFAMTGPRAMEWHAMMAAEENAVLTLQEEGLDTQDYELVESERFFSLCFGSQECLIDMYTREGTEF